MKAIALIVATVAALAAGCSHHVMETYPKYLANNPNTLVLTPVGQPATYSMTPATQKHTNRITSAMAGAAHKWYIEFGKALAATMESADVKRAFTSLVATAGPGQGLHLQFDVKEYDYRDHRAHVSVAVQTFVGTQPVANQTYSAQGASQGGKVFWGGAAAMRNAIQQSTKSAMDQIMAKLVADITAGLKTAPVGTTLSPGPRPATLIARATTN